MLQLARASPASRASHCYPAYFSTSNLSNKTKRHSQQVSSHSSCIAAVWTDACGARYGSSALTKFRFCLGLRFYDNEPND
jgi:hypothetical protein